MLISLLFVPLTNVVNAQNIEGPGGVFDQGSDNNANCIISSGRRKNDFF